jgi:TP901 family phage tail tape measure protein
MSRALTIPAIFTAIDKFTAPIRAMGASVQNFAAKTESAIARADMTLRKITPSLGDLTNQMASFASVAAIGGLLVFSGKAIMDYEKSLASLSAITGVTGEALKEFEGAALKTASETKKSSIDILQAFELVGSAKPELLSNADALAEVTKQTIILSKAGKLETGDAVTALTTALNQYGAGAEKAAMFTDILATAQQKGSGTIEYLNAGIVKSGGIMKAFGNEFEDNVALLEGFAAAGVPAAESGTMLAGIMSKLAKVNKAEFNPQHTKAVDIIQNLADANLSYNDLLKMTDAEGAKWITTLVNQNTVVQKLAGNLNEVGNAQSQAATNSNTLSNRLAELQAAWVNMMTGNSEASKGLETVKNLIVIVTENLGTIIGVIGVVIATFAAWHAALMVAKVGMVAYNAIANMVFLVQTIKYIAATQGLTIAQAALTVAQNTLNAAMLANPIGLIVIGIMAAIAVIVIIISYWDELTAIIINAAKAIYDFFIYVIGVVIYYWEKLKAVIVTTGTVAAAFFAPVLILFGLLISLMGSVWRNWDMIAQGFKDGGIIGGLKAMGVTLMDAVLSPLQQILIIASKLPGKVGQLAAEGAKSIEAFRADMGVNVAGGETETPEAVNPEASRQEAMAQRMETVQKQNVSIDVKDSTGRAKVESDNNLVPVNVTNTMSWQ